MCAVVAVLACVRGRAGINFGLNPRVVIDGVMLPADYIISTDTVRHRNLTFRIPAGQGKGHVIQVWVANQSTSIGADAIPAILDYGAPNITAVFPPKLGGSTEVRHVMGGVWSEGGVCALTAESWGVNECVCVSLLPCRVAKWSRFSERTLDCPGRDRCPC